MANNFWKQRKIIWLHPWIYSHISKSNHSRNRFLRNFVSQGPFWLDSRDSQNGERTRALSKLLKKEFNFGRLFLHWLLFSQHLLPQRVSKTLSQILIAARVTPRTWMLQWYWWQVWDVDELVTIINSSPDLYQSQSAWNLVEKIME